MRLIAKALCAFALSLSFAVFPVRAMADEPITQRQEQLSAEEAAILLETIDPASANETQVGELVDGWFFEVSTRDSSGEKTYYIAVDKSAVYRIEEGTPKLIYGSAQPMLDQEPIFESQDRIFVSEEEQRQGMAGADAPIVLVDIPSPVSVSTTLDSWRMRPGEEAGVNVQLPGGLLYSVNLSSSNESVIKVNEDMTFAAVGEGEATMSIELMVDDAKKVYSIWLDVVKAAIDVNEIPEVIEVGEWIDLSGFSEFYGRSAEWSVSDPDLADLEYSYGYQLNALQPGVVVVSASLEELQYEKEITIVPSSGIPDEGVSPLWIIVGCVFAAAAVIALLMLKMRKGQTGGANQ
ncbi:MAG: hypothetical protein LBT59_25065 [Clostridiales bacterium]|nr:hypothetical protein [Clostridiales bacterium]